MTFFDICDLQFDILECCGNVVDRFVGASFMRVKSFQQYLDYTGNQRPYIILGSALSHSETLGTSLSVFCVPCPSFSLR